MYQARIYDYSKHNKWREYAAKREFPSAQRPNLSTIKIARNADESTIQEEK